MPKVNPEILKWARAMSTVNVNPEILRWARETAGLSREEAVRKLPIRDVRGMNAVDRLAALESGTAEPTRPTLVNMARHYRRPLLTFYMSDPPQVAERGAYYRTLPADVSETDYSIMDTLIRNVRVSQSIVRAALEDEDENEPLSFIGSVTIDDGEPLIRERMASLLEVAVEDFYAQPNASAAFDLLRADIERLGAFVLLKGDLGSHHTAIDAETFRGFAIADDVAPFIVINDKDARPAWSFTLLHELAHLLLGQSGLSNGLEDDYVERLCDDVAGGFLLPERQLALLGFRHFSGTDHQAESVISEFASDRNLSHSMVAYRAYRANRISRATYTSLSASFRSRWIVERDRRRERNRHGKGGPSYYTVRRHRTGKALLDFTRSMLLSGELSTTKAAKVLGVKPTQVGAMLNFG